MSEVLEAQKSSAMRFLDQLLHNQTESVSAVWMYALLGIEQPFPEWVAERLEFNGWKSPDDYIRVGNDVHFSPLAAVLVFTSGGSPVAAHVQVKYCQMVAKALAGRDIFEVMDTAIKSETAKEFLQRELDPERCVDGRADDAIDQRGRRKRRQTIDTVGASRRP